MDLSSLAGFTARRGTEMYHAKFPTGLCFQEVTLSLYGIPSYCFSKTPRGSISRHDLVKTWFSIIKIHSISKIRWKDQRNRRSVYKEPLFSGCLINLHLLEHRDLTVFALRRILLQSSRDASHTVLLIKVWQQDSVQSFSVNLILSHILMLENWWVAENRIFS